MTHSTDTKVRSFCKHQPHRTITNIREPRYSTNDVLINVRHIVDSVDHYLVKFTDCKSIPEWFYLSGKEIRKGKVQINGSGRVYVVSLSKREDFVPQDKCEHIYK